MFSSKTPRDLNHDPYPNVWDGHTPFNQMRADHDKFRKGAPVGVIGSMTYLHRPRPEFDHVQHNPPNRVLTAFRTREPDVTLDFWLFAFSAYAAFGGWSDWDDPRHPVHALAMATEEEIDHARRVLTRLAHLSGGES